MIIVLVIVTVLLSFLSGYVLGKKRGQKDEKELSTLYAPLLIRTQSLEKGECLICMSSIDCQKKASMIE